MPFKERWLVDEQMEIVLAADEPITMMHGALEAAASLPAHLQLNQIKSNQIIIHSFK